MCNRRLTTSPQATQPSAVGDLEEASRPSGWRHRSTKLSEIKDRNDGKFITLTFSNESIKKLVNVPATKNWPGMSELTGYDLDNEIAIRATRLFLERWRKEYKKKPSALVRYRTRS